MSIFVNYLLNSRLLDLELRLVKTMLRKLLRHEIVLCDLILFLCKITAHIDHLHTVLKCRLDRLDIVCSSDEEHIRQIIVDIQIVIVECCILLRIKRFEQCRRRIALYILCQFVNLVQHNDRI